MGAVIGDVANAVTGKTRKRPGTLRRKRRGLSVEQVFGRSNVGEREQRRVLHGEGSFASCSIRLC